MDKNIKKESRKLRRTLRSGAYTAVVCVILAVILVFVNLIVSALPKSAVKLDLTAEGLYSLGDTTRQVLETVDEDIYIYQIVEESQENATISSFIERYASANSHIKISTVDPGVNPNFTAQYTDESLSNNSLIVVGPKRNTVIQASDMYQYYVNGQYMSGEEYNNYYYYMSMYGMSVSGEPFFFAEQEITSAIDYVITENIPVMYYTSKHGETEVNSTYTKAISDENIELKELDLLAAGSIPEDAEALIINAPTLDFTADETALLKTYMENGGNVVLLTNYRTDLNENMPNLSALCGDMGLASVDGLLIEEDSSAYIQYPYFTLPTLNESSAPARLMKSTNVYVIMLYAHGIQINDDTPYTATPILTSTDKAYIKATNAQTGSKEDGDPSGEFYTGVHVAVGESGDTDAGSFVWYSSSEIMNEQFSSYGNSDLFISTLNTMCDKKSSISIIGKSLDAGRLTMNSTQSFMWQTVVIVIVPLAVIVCGIGIWYRRRRR